MTRMSYGHMVHLEHRSSCQQEMSSGVTPEGPSLDVELVKGDLGPVGGVRRALGQRVDAQAQRELRHVGDLARPPLQHGQLVGSAHPQDCSLQRGAPPWAAAATMTWPLLADWCTC